MGACRRRQRDSVRSLLRPYRVVDHCVGLIHVCTFFPMQESIQNGFIEIKPMFEFSCVCCFLLCCHNQR